MKTQNSWRFTMTKLSVLIMAALALTTAALAADKAKQNQGNPGIVPPNQQGIYMQLQAAWWQWAAGIPWDKNPILDTTGEFAGINQDGPVWFLAGSFFGTVERTCQVPAGKMLFFPVVNCSYVHNLKEDPKVKEQRAICQGFVGGVQNVWCKVDGQPVNNLDKYLTESAVFKVALPDGNIYGIDKGTYPAVDYGCYLLLEPLPPGVHTIEIHAELWADWDPEVPGPELHILNVTYNLTVVPEI